MLILADFARSVYGRWRVQRIIAGLVAMTMLIVITAMLICSVLLAGLYGLYILLISSGTLPSEALLLVVGFGLLITLLFIGITYVSIRRLRHMPRRLFGDSILAQRAEEAVDAFLDGLMDAS